MNKKTSSVLVVLIVSIVTVNAIFDNLPDKRVKARKPVDESCLAILHNRNATLMERCEFFKCFEDRYPCGSNYWVINWGYKYCRRYADQTFIDKFTDVGKELLAFINECLPNHFEKFYKSKRQLRCKKLYRDAFEAQGDCYAQVQEKFCKAFPENKKLFIEVLDPADFMNIDSITMIRKTAENCEPKLDLLSIMG